MTDSKKIFLDTAAIIYYVENKPIYFDNGCNMFLTNDKQLKQFDSFYVELVDEIRVMILLRVCCSWL